EVPEVYRTQVNDVLLAALAEVLTGWTGSERVLVALEGHGREEIGPELDVARTVGWFTALFPLLLDLAGLGGRRELLRSVHEQLRAGPRRGPRCGLVRYLAARPAR